MKNFVFHFVFLSLNRNFAGMRKDIIFAVATIVVTALTAACNRTKNITEPTEESHALPSQGYVAKGDSMLYGLACDGCNDSVVVVLPDSGGDPKTFSIINAMKQHHVFGTPVVGDQVAVMVNPQDTTEVLYVINLEELKGTWTYQQMPVARQINEERLQQMTDEEKHERDSLIQRAMVPVEFGYTLKRDNTIRSVGHVPRTTSLEMESPVVYPRQKWYSEWHVFNGNLIFTKTSRAKNDSTPPPPPENDTVSILMMKKDTLVLKMPDRIQGFSRKPDSLIVK